MKNNKFLFFANASSFSFAKVSNMSQSIEYETITEGGYNESPHLMVKQKTKPDTIILEGGILRNDTLYDIATKLTVGKGIYIGMIIVLGEGLISGKKMYTFDKGIVTKVDIGELSAMSGEILIKKLEITHSGLKEVSL